MIIDRGIIHHYDATTHTAAVQLFGSMSRILLAVPVAHHIPAELLTTGARCAIAFFAEGSQGLIFATFEGNPSPALNLSRWGPTLTIEDLLGAWTDHFLGDSLDPRYATTIGNATIAIDKQNAGVVRLHLNAVAGAVAYLWLGDSAGSYDNLDADDGWVGIWRFRLSGTSDLQAYVGGESAGGTDRIQLGVDSSQGADFYIRTKANGGSNTYTSLAVAADTQWHTWAIQAQTAQVLVWLDRVLVATHTSNVPTGPLQGEAIVYTPGGTATNMDLDYAAWIPRSSI